MDHGLWIEFLLRTARGSSKISCLKRGYIGEGPVVCVQRPWNSLKKETLASFAGEGGNAGASMSANNTNPAAVLQMNHCPILL